MRQAWAQTQIPLDESGKILSGTVSIGVAPLEPDAPLDMLRHMDFLPERSFYVGDSNVDIFTARNAGMISIGVAWGFRGADELRAAQADHIIETPQALTRLAEEA